MLIIVINKICASIKHSVVPVFFCSYGDGGLTGPAWICGGLTLII